MTTAATVDTAISVKDISKKYRIEKIDGKAPHFGLMSPLHRLRGILTGKGGGAVYVKEFWALEGVTFEVARGERLAIIGRNGAGKTTLLKILSRIVAPTRGEARIRGRLTSLLEVGTGFQNQLTGRENIFVNASMHGLGKKETQEKLEQIVEFSGIDRRFIDMRVKHYSSGMRVRLAFSVAAHLDPDILLLDEVLAVGDMAFQEKCLERVEGMMKERRTVVLVSHDMSSVTRYCTRAIWLEQGHVVMDAPSQEVVTAYTAETRKAITSRRWTQEDSQRGAAANRQAQLPRFEEGNGAGSSGPEPSEQIVLGPEGVLREPPAARFVSACVVDKDRREVKGVTVDQTVGIELVYDVLCGGKVILPAATFHDAANVHLFTAVYTDPEYMQKPKEAGRYVSVLWIRPHLFNTGTMYATISLTTPTSGKLERHVVIDKALTLDVFEAPFGTPSARGTYREVKGAVRPLLEWETSKS